MFEDWKKIYGAKLQDRQELDVRTTELWAIALQQLKITPKEFNLCMSKSISLQWPPTAPADFLALGRTETTSPYPEIKDAYNRAANNKFKKHEVIYETARRVGFWNLKTQSEHVSYKAWQEHYPTVCNEHSEGARFTVPVSHQVAYEHTPVQAGTAFDSELNDFFANFGKKGEMV